MLRPSHKARGATLIELIVGISITAGLLAMAIPNFSAWIQNGQIRTSAEGIQAGLQLARATAVQRNNVVIFSLTTTMTSACATSTAGPNWIVSMEDPSGNCGTAASDVTTPRIIQAGAAADGTRNAVVASDQASISFNGLGRRINAGNAANVAINISNTTGGDCAAIGGPMRCLRVLVSASGQIRMCDPAAGASDTRAC